MNNRSFTLIELLVVITIVGILSGFVLVSLNGAVNSAQNARIKNDIDSLRKVILSYKALYGVAPIEDPACNIGSDCSQLSSDLLTMNPNISFPTNQGGYYTYSSADGTDFTLKATLSDDSIYQYRYSTGFSNYTPVEQVLNGGFEAGTSYWTVGSGWNSASEAKYIGNYGGYFLVNQLGDGPAISQNIDITNVNQLTFWARIIQGEGSSPILNVKIGSTLVGSYHLYSSPSLQNWSNISIDVSSCSGQQTISFYGNGDNGSGQIYIDEIKALAEGGEEQRVLNKGFETGDFTAWTTHGDTGVYNDNCIHSGSYGAFIYGYNDDPAYIQQTINFTNINQLTFWEWHNIYGDGYASVYIGDTEVWTSSTEQLSYQQITIDTSGFSGNQILKFFSNDADLYIDDISAMTN